MRKRSEFGQSAPTGEAPKPLKKRSEVAAVTEPAVDISKKFIGGIEVVSRRRQAVDVAIAAVKEGLDDIDKAIQSLRVRLGVGFAITVVAPGTISPVVLCAWTRLSALKAQSPHASDRRVFCDSVRECLAYVEAYEDRVDAEGEDAAHRWHVEQRAKKS